MSQPTPESTATLLDNDPQDAVSDAQRANITIPDDLIERAQDGDADAQNEVLGRVTPLAYSLVRSREHDIDRVDDIVQTGLLKVFEGGLRQRPEKPIRNFGAWVNMVVQRTWIDADRRRKTAKSESCDPAIVLERAEIVGLPADLSLVEDYLEVMAYLKDAKVSENALASFVLLHGYGFSINDIAEIFEAKQGTVKSRISTAKTALQSATSEAAHS